MRRTQVEGFGWDGLESFLFFGSAGEPGFHEDFGGGGRFDDFVSAWEAVGGLEGDFRSLALSEAALEIRFAEEIEVGGGAAIDEGHHKEASPAGVADRPR